ncbi:MFS transporter [Actinokineospora fastidiosa]|uniref:MFS transporter n=1 Tax=Actinokineospora fastidiosa TaxID=1816 RepID=UPI003570EB95
MAAVTTTELRAGPRQWLGLAVLALPTLLLALDITVLHLAVPHLSADLRPSGSQLLWIVDIYGFMIAGFLVTMGTLGDRVGRRRLLLIGAAAFGVASVLAAYATSPELLIAARTALGVAGATLMPSTLALISNMFRDPGQRGVAIGIWATMFSVGVAIGPIVGGALLAAFWWGSVFLLGVPIMLLLLVAGPVLLPEFRDRAAGRPDLASVALSLAAMLPITFGIKELADPVVAVPAIVVGLVMGALFVRRQRRLADPLLDLGLFGARAVRAALVILLVATATISGAYLFITQYLQLVVGLSPLMAGLWLLPAATVLVMASMAAPLLARRFGAGRVVAVALVVSSAGFVVLTAADGLTTVVVGFVVAYSGIGPVFALGTDLVVGSADPAKAGAASALSETSTELGVSIGIATLGSIGTAVYRAGSGGSDTLAEAVAAAEALPAAEGDALLRMAGEAFTAGLVTIAWVSAALLAAVAAVALVALRDRVG